MNMETMETGNKWFDRWVTPHVVLVLIGTIFSATIWGIQLNIAVVNLTKSVAELSSDSQLQHAELGEYSSHVTRTALILENLEKRMAKAEVKSELHEKDAAEWKYRIIQLESDSKK